MKWRTYPPDVLPLWVAEMDVPLAAPVVRAVTDALVLGDTGYPAGTAYAEALAEFAEKRWGWDGCAVERTAIVPDVMMGIVEMLRLVTGNGDPVVVNPPVYPPFFQFIEHMDRRVVEAPLGSDLRIDLDVLEEAFQRAVAGGGRAAYLLCSPQNPTGTVHTADELAAVAALAERYGVRVVVDEIHAPLTASGVDFVPYLSVPGAERGLALMSASKGWNLAGLKAALAVAGPAAAADLARLPEEVSPRAQPPRRHRPHGGPAGRHRVARRAARRARREPTAADRPPRRTPPVRRLPSRRGHLPRLARLPRTRPRRRPGRRLPGAGAGGTEPRDPLRYRRGGTRTPESRDLAGGDRGGRTAHGGGPRPSGRRGCHAHVTTAAMMSPCVC